MHWWFSQRWRSGTNRERTVLFISPACPSSLASLAGVLSAETSLQRSFSLNHPPLPPGQLQPSRTACAVMALCHSAVPGDSKSHHLCSPTSASFCALSTTYPSLPPLLPDALLKASGKGIFNIASCSPGKALFAVSLLFSAILKAFLQMSGCFCFC